MAIVLRRNLAGLLHSTGAKKANETNKTVVLLQICVKKLQKKLGRARSIITLPSENI